MEPTRAMMVAERNGTVRRIIALQGVSFAARMSRKKPQTIERLQTEIRSLRVRVREIDQTINNA